jgi:hypothetical protein
MQACHRTIALKSDPDLDEAAGWSIYLDDTTVLEKVQAVVAEELAGTPAEEQKQLREAYSWWGIPTSEAKSLERVRQAERLGALIDGQEGS